LAKKERDPAVELVLRHLYDEKPHHEQWVSTIEDRYRTYLGVVERKEEASDVLQWTSKLTPPYAMQIVEGVVASLLDDRMSFKLKPWPLLTNSQDIDRLMEGARAAELLLQAQLDQARFHAKCARPWMMQAVITGLTCTKQYWKVEKRKTKRKRLEVYTDIWGEQIGEDYIPEEIEATMFEGPCIEVVDVRSLIFEESATCPEDTWIIQQSFVTIDQLRELEKLGYYKNIDQIPMDRDEYERNIITDDFRHLEEELWNENKTRGRVELLEFWSRDGSEKITVANRRVHIDPHDRKNPFWHGRKPYAFSSTSTYPFRIPGISLTQKVAQLQEYLWSIMNQRLDNLRLINNAIFMIRDDAQDFEAFEFFPGAQWPVSDATQVVPWTPNGDVARYSLEAEALIKADLQNLVSGGVPPSGPNTQIDAETATAAAIITTIAQRLIAHQKQNVLYGAEEMGTQMLGLDQQFLDAPKLIPRIGQDGAIQFESVFPDDIQMDYVVNIEPVMESLVRQEKRAEAIQLVTAVSNMLPNLVSVGVYPNMRELVADLFRAFDKDSIDRYFSTQPPPAMAQMMAGAGGGGGGGEIPGASVNGVIASGNGVTSELATSPMSPSSPISGSGEQFLQRALALTGGANNVG
jgi:hypothetical protein